MSSKSGQLKWIFLWPKTQDSRGALTSGHDISSKEWRDERGIWGPSFCGLRAFLAPILRYRTMLLKDWGRDGSWRAKGMECQSPQLNLPAKHSKGHMNLREKCAAWVRERTILSQFSATCLYFIDLRGTCSTAQNAVAMLAKSSFMIGDCAATWTLLQLEFMYSSWEASTARPVWVAEIKYTVSTCYIHRVGFGQYQGGCLCKCFFAAASLLKWNYRSRTGDKFPKWWIEPTVEDHPYSSEPKE